MSFSELATERSDQTSRAFSWRPGLPRDRSNPRSPCAHRRSGMGGDRGVRDRPGALIFLGTSSTARCWRVAAVIDFSPDTDHPSAAVKPSRERPAGSPAGAEGATAPETLRQKDREEDG